MVAACGRGDTLAAMVRRTGRGCVAALALALAGGLAGCGPIRYVGEAETHNDFARHALDEGNYTEARGEAAIAETGRSRSRATPTARAAIARTSRCRSAAPRRCAAT